jgi:hypothetical protein
MADAMHGLSWLWILVMATAPGVVGVLVAIPAWREQQIILGNLAGTFVIAGAAIALIMREHVELDGIARRCIDAGVLCRPEPAPFIRYAIYAGIAMLEVFAVFMISLKVEERHRRRGYDPEWR